MRFIFSSLFKNKFTCDLFGKSSSTFVEIYKLHMPYFHLLFRSTVKIKSSPLRDISVRCIAQFEVDRLGERSPKAPPRRTFAVNLCTFFTRNHSSISRGSEIRGIVKRSSIRRRLAPNEPVWSLTLFITSRYSVGRAFRARTNTLRTSVSTSVSTEIPHTLAGYPLIPRSQILGSPRSLITR